MRNPEKHDLFELYARICSMKNYPINDANSMINFKEDISKALSMVEDLQMYGKVTELSFFQVVKSLKKVECIKQEDSGEIYSRYEVIIPDYRITLADNRNILVEVKNNNLDVSKLFSMNDKYFAKLEKYGEINKLDIFIAIYWRKMNIWTLNKLSNFIKKNNSYKISFLNAMENNHMYLLGDLNIATTPKLSIRIYPVENCAIKKEIEFTISNVKIYCGETEIIKREEKSIAFLLMFFGDWKSENEAIRSPNNELKYVECNFIPYEIDESVKQQGFAFVGFLSSIYTAYYRYLIAPEGTIQSIYIDNDLHVEIPDDYESNALPLWRFIMKPEI